MSESDILALIRGNATIPYRIYIDGNSTPLTENEIISTSYEDYRFVDTDSLVIGQFVARTLNGEIKNINRDLLIENKEIEVQMGVKVGDTTTWYSLGNFLITKPEEDDVKDKMTFKSMDYTKKFNKTFDNSLITFPCTALELAQGVCSQCGVELGTTDFTNADFVIENSQYDSGDSCRKVMQDIGKLAYSWVRIGWDNKCYIDFEVKTNVEDYNIITNDNYYDFKKQQKQFGPVNRVVIGLKDVDGENVAVQDDDSIAQNGLHTLYIYDNNLTYTPELRQQVINGATRLFGLKYTPIETNTTGHPWLLGNEVVRMIDMDGSVVESYPFDRTIEYMGHIKTKLVSKADTQVQHEYINNNTLGALLTRTKIIVDKQNQTIQGVVEKSEENSEKIVGFEATIDDIKSSVSSTETLVKDLENSIDLFSVDLSQYTLTIPTDSSNKPLETKNYDILFYGYYKGKQVTPTVSIDGNNTGITTSKTNTYVRFSVNSTTMITKISNDYTLIFTYNSPDGVYTVTKKVTISLSIQGKDGTPGKDGTSVNILGSYNSLEELKQAHPTGNIGDAYIVQGDMYVWSAEENDWVDVGNIQGPKGEDGYTPQKGVDYFDGKNGEDGKDGVSRYFYVRYSANANGNPMTTTPQSDTEYMGTADTTSATPPTSYTAYTWVKIKGDTGKTGTPGTPGENGLTSYLHIKYSEDGLTFTPADDDYEIGEKPSAWIGQYVDYNEDDSTNFNDYEWYKFTEDIDGTLSEMQSNIGKNTTNINNNYQDLVNQIDKKASDEELITVKNSIETVQTNLNARISATEEILANGVSKVSTTSGTFDKDGLTIEKSGAETKTTLNQIGVNVKDSSTNDALFAGYVDDAKAEENNKKLEKYKGQTVVYTNNTIVDVSLTVGTHSRLEDYEDGTGIFVFD